jgi:poly(hydroxyalkanoate) granule-associated protein
MNTQTAKSNVQQLQEELKQTADNAVSMARKTASGVQSDVKDLAGDARDAVQRIFRAGLGAMVVAEEEGTRLFKQLVSRGEEVDVPNLRLGTLRERIDDGADRVTEAVKGRAEDARYAAGEAAGKVEDRLQEAVAGVMRRLGVPTREEVTELTASVERLSARIDKMKAEKAAASVPAIESVGGGWYEVRVGATVVEKVQGREEAEAALARLNAQQA